MSDDYISDGEETQSELSPQAPISHNIPPALRIYPQWVCWTYALNEAGALCRVPVSQMASLDETYQRCLDEWLGLGFVLVENDPFVAVHLLDYFDKATNKIKIMASEVMSLLDTYTEIDDTADGLHLMAMARGETNMKGDGIEVWTQDYMVPITGDKIGIESEAAPRQSEIRYVVETFCVQTWMQRVERMQGSGDEKEVLAHVLKDCLSTHNWLQDADRTGLFPFLGKCWAYPELRILVGSIPYMSSKMMKDIESAIAPYIPKKPKTDKHAVVMDDGKGLQGEYQRTNQGQIKESQANWEIMLEQEPHWQRRLRFNAFHQKVEIDGESISEQSRAEISSWASHNLELSGSNTKNRDQALLVVSAKDTYDPLQEYLEALPSWDGTSRLPTLFQTYFGSESDAYSLWLGPMMLTSMIARALKPACICRYAVILKGDQDIGKSEAVRSLGGDWTVELSGDMGSRDSQIQLKGVWVVELGELNAIRKSHRDEVKRFVSARYDEFTLKHQNDAVKYKRRCVFIGTGNADEVLNDPTGSTRWFPIKVTKADYQGLARDRDQLFAEAMERYQQHEHDWWVIPAEVAVILEEVREESRVVGPYEEKLVEWLLENQPKDDEEKLSTTWLQLANECLDLDKSQWKSIQTFVTDSLRAMGWLRKQKRIKGTFYGKEWRWYAPDGWADRYHKTTQSSPPRDSELPIRPANLPREPDDDLSLMVSAPSWARPASNKISCRQCHATIGVGMVDGLCSQCR